MSVFDLFRGFFSVPGGHHRGRRDPFFDAMTHDDDDDEEEDGFYHDGYRGEEQDPFDSAWRFGFSMGPDGMRIQEPPLFGHVLREMEEIFSQMGQWDAAPESGHFGVPNIMPQPPSQDRLEEGGGASSGNPLREFMLKTPDRDTRGPQPGPQTEPRHDGRPLSKFYDMWGQGLEKTPAGEHRGDRDLDSAVSAGGLDQILTPPAGQAPSQPRIHSFFQSVSISKVVKPDGTVEERRTVRDGKGNEETTVTRSGGPGVLEGPGDRPVPVLPGGQRPFSDLRDDDSLFSKLFGGFK
ncbi:HCLS1-associated protein X-1 [Hippoglossus hippoglossus]|uniref:HCLS1-associated protein X-1 n=1 Tax=Hippoglossus hippoglossus TaxID=8267 RepID=UPI00148CB751|nr:HCLS1-associated protein X-1 [Hippoglossus hippoglossus]